MAMAMAVAVAAAAAARRNTNSTFRSLLQLPLSSLRFSVHRHLVTYLPLSCCSHNDIDIKQLPPIKQRTEPGPPEEACILKTEDGWSPPQVLDTPFPRDSFNVDIGGWVVKFKSPSLKDKDFTERQMYNLCVNTLTRFIGKEEAKKKIYLISNHPYAPGFCATIDHETVCKLRDLRRISGVIPDFRREARMSHPETYPMGQGQT